MSLIVKPAETCRYDVLSLGEVMVRFDPGEGRIRNAREFKVWEGGGEYNVARGLRRCFGQRAAVVTGIARNEVGFLLEDLILQGGVDLSLSKWFDYDGIGRSVRNGLNFVERGFGVRGALGCSDRGHSATSQIKPGDIDWGHIFGELGVRWFHTGGIYAALSDDAMAVAAEAMQAAKRHGTVVSYDLNYRASLWEGRGGLAQCQATNQALAPMVDVMIGFPGFLLADPFAASETPLDVVAFEALIERAVSRFAYLKVFASTVRQSTSASRAGWSAVCWDDGSFYQSDGIADLDILDRVGGGDGFASGLIYGLMESLGPQRAIEYGNAHGALAMTTPGDNSVVSLDEVQALLGGEVGATRR